MFELLRSIEMSCSANSEMYLLFIFMFKQATIFQAFIHLVNWLIITFPSFPHSLVLTLLSGLKMYAVFRNVSLRIKKIIMRPASFCVCGLCMFIVYQIPKDKYISFYEFSHAHKIIRKSEIRAFEHIVIVYWLLICFTFTIFNIIRIIFFSLCWRWNLLFCLPYSYDICIQRQLKSKTLPSAHSLEWTPKQK